jgi:predicted transposase YbfD/YdcC
MMDAQICADATRGHWGIENCNHHVRDVTFEEDKSRIRIKPLIMASLRSFALNILRHTAQKTSPGSAVKMLSTH